jgi:hypothetical protein
MVSVPRYADWATIWGNGSSIVDTALDSLDRPTPCDGMEPCTTGDGVLRRPLGRRTEVRRCPIREQCLSAGAAGREIGVWGGKFSADGVNWHDVRPVRQSNLVRTLEAAIANKRGIGMVSAADKVLPGLKALLTDQRAPWPTRPRGSASAATRAGSPHPTAAASPSAPTS